MTRAELLAQADTMEWMLQHEDIQISHGTHILRACITELRAQAEKAADPQPVATWMGTDYIAHRQCFSELAHLEPGTPLFLHPDPRIAELLPLLRALDSLTNPDDNFDSAINPGPERDELLAAYTACKGVAR